MSDAPKKDSPKNVQDHLALQLVAVVPDGTPRDATLQPQPERNVEPGTSLPAGAALWFDDPDSRYILH